MTLRPAKKILLGFALAALIVAIYLWLSRSGELSVIADGQTMKQRFLELGALGPLLVIGLMALAIVASPLPSAPIAVATGSAFGHTWGTIYVLAGAELGALIAFALARCLGYEVVRRWFGDRLSLGRATSQNALTVAVLVSRLIPFISFDVVSYAAGLTPLTAWRFAAATLVGIIPASFFLAHVGSELTTSDPARVAVSVLAFGALTGLTLLLHVAYKRRKPAREP